MRSVAVIPAFNEEKTIGQVVRQTKQYVNEVIVMDDHCTDDTREEALKARAMVRSTSNGRGAGKAIKTGIINALNVYIPDAIVLLDGDGQHNPDDIPAMLSLLKDFDMVVTSRFMDKMMFTNMPLYRKVGIWAITFAYNFGAKFKVRDS